MHDYIFSIFSPTVAAGRPTFYDAFVCYNYEPEGDDLKFVLQMIEKLECPPHSLKLFVPHRDDLPGASKHVISAKLIQDRYVPLMFSCFVFLNHYAFRSEILAGKR